MKSSNLWHGKAYFFFLILYKEYSRFQIGKLTKSQKESLANKQRGFMIDKTDEHLFYEMKAVPSLCGYTGREKKDNIVI